MGRPTRVLRADSRVSALASFVAPREEQPSSASASGSEDGPEDNIWEAKEILREKRGKVYVSWVCVLSRRQAVSAGPPTGRRAAESRHVCPSAPPLPLCSGQDKQGRPYPSTWEPRSHCNELLLAEWDAKQARRKEVDKRRKSGGDKPASARAADDGSKGQKRKRGRLPPPTSCSF